jgi:uncharacterized membrane protein HdeD (DUF308 family)
MIGLMARDFLRGHWWVFVLRGLAAIAFGAIAILWPGLSLATLVLLFGAFALVEGSFALVGAIAHREARWGWHVVDGVAGIAIGVMTFVWTIDTAIVLLYFIGAWAIVSGGFRIVHALRVRHMPEPAWLIGIGGIASVLFGAWVIIAPGAGALALIWLIGTYAIFVGVLFVIAGIRVRTLPATMLAAS